MYKYWHAVKIEGAISADLCMNTKRQDAGQLRAV